jgi:hypothetical protein
MFLMCYLKINTQCYATVVYTRIQRSLCKLHVVHSNLNIQCLNDISAKRHVEQIVSSSSPLNRRDRDREIALKLNKATSG